VRWQSSKIDSGGDRGAKKGAPDPEISENGRRQFREMDAAALFRGVFTILRRPGVKRLVY
jgi:hypothetical protein